MEGKGGKKTKQHHKPKKQQASSPSQAQTQPQPGPPVSPNVPEQPPKKDVAPSPPQPQPTPASQQQQPAQAEAKPPKTPKEKKPPQPASNLAVEASVSPQAEAKPSQQPAKSPKQEQPKPHHDKAMAPSAPAGEASAPAKSNAELRAERRAKQEAQRAAKAAAKGASGEGVAAPKGNKPEKAEAKKAAQPQQQSQQANRHKSGQRVPDDMQADRASVEKKLQRTLASAHLPARTKAQRKVMLFSHLHQYERELSISRDLPIVGGALHPAILQLGLQLSEGTYSGSNARCVALLNALKKVIHDFVTPPQKEFLRELDSRLKPYITFLRQCRTLSVSMGNAIRFVKARINALNPSVPEAEAKAQLTEAIDGFVHENIDLASEQIAITALEKIKDGDVILTYGCSSLLCTVFTHAKTKGRQFRVIVADSRPKLEGRELARRLVNAGVDCAYIQVTTVPYVMREVSKVFLGAHAVFANGCVMSRVGSSQVALVAKASNVPVLICCETYKFSERVQTDSFVFNELGDPDDLVYTGRTDFTPLCDWRDFNSLCLLNLAYDVTPASLVGAIISEISVIPTTSVPVVLRLKNMEHSTAY